MEFLIQFWNYVKLSAPYLLFGFLIGGIIHVFLPIDKVKKMLGKGSFINVIKASFIGVPLPLCSCSVIPTAVSLRKSGAGNGPTSSFLIATPESGVDSIAMTYGLMDLPMTIIRPIAAFLSAIFAGVLQNGFNKFEYKEVGEEKKSCCSKNKIKSENKLVKALKYGFVDLVNDISFWLFVGLVCGALISFFVPENFFDTLSGIQGKFIMLLVGVPLYICASATTPIAASLVLKGMSPGTALIILLVGPATNISNLLVLQKYVGKKGVILNVIAIVTVALLMSFFTDWMYQNYFSGFQFKASHHNHESSYALLENSMGIVLIILILKGLYSNEIMPRLKKRKSGCH